MTESVKTNRNPNNPAFWEQHFVQYRLARCSKLAYCRKHGLTYHRFLYWADKLKAVKAVSVAKKPPLEFVPLQLAQPTLQASNALATIQLKDGAILHIHNRGLLFDLIKQLGA